MENSFCCEHCQAQVVISHFMGTAHRNHCPFCLWSKHVDEKISGDRKSKCLGLMEPKGLAFKKIKSDKYGKDQKGELMIVHQCQKCGKTNRNRIAGDDNSKAILALGEEKDKEEAKKQLFGKTEAPRGNLLKDN